MLILKYENTYSYIKRKGYIFFDWKKMIHILRFKEDDTYSFIKKQDTFSYIERRGDTHYQKRIPMFMGDTSLSFTLSIYIPSI